MFKATGISIPVGISIPMEFPFYGILVSNKKEHIIDTHTLNESAGNYTEWIQYHFLNPTFGHGYEISKDNRQVYHS